MPQTSSVLLDDLSKNTAWLKQIATSLVGASEADDLVQETMETALRDPPPKDRPVKPWLTAVLHNLARMHWRSSVRRRKREEVTAIPEALELPEASLGRLELHREILELVLAMREPYRQTIVLRFVHELSAQEISRHLEIPASTVRSRVKRGLTLLRDELDQSHDPHQWRAALMLPLPTPLSVIGKRAATGAGAMKVGIALACTVTLLAVASASSGPLRRSTSHTLRHELLASEHAAEPYQTRSPLMKAEEPPVWSQSTSDHPNFRQVIRAARGDAPRQKMSYDFSGVRIGEERIARPPRSATGTLDKHYIQDRIAEIIPLVAECHGLAAINRPLTGALTVDFVVDATEGVGGYVREARIAEESPLSDPLLSECVIETIESLEFVAPKDGGIVQVRYPFIFGESDQS